MADKPINQINVEGTDISDNAYMVIDEDLGGGVYETRKVKWLTVLTTAIRGFAKLASNNVFTGTNRFNKQVKVVSDGTNSPLVVRNSTDTADLMKLAIDGSVEINKGGTVDGDIRIYSPSGLFYPKVMFFNNGNLTTPQYTFQGYLGGDHESESGFSFKFSATSNPDYRCFSIGAQWLSVPNYEKVAFAVTSTTKGVLIPRLTTTQRNAMGSTLPTSLLIFNSTTNQYEFWNGSAWTGLGDINNASNVGAVGSGIFKDKTGTTLNFRKLVNAGGIGVAINGDNVELTNQHVNIVDMNDTFFGTLVTNDLIQYDGGSWVNVQPYDIYKVNATVNTTNNTLTLLKAYTLSDGIHQMELDITGFETATGNTYTGRFFPNVRVVSGVATLVNTFNDFAQVGVLGFSTGGGFGVSASLSTNVLSINVTGKNATNITWNIKTIKL